MQNRSLHKFTGKQTNAVLYKHLKNDFKFLWAWLDWLHKAKWLICISVASLFYSSEKYIQLLEENRLFIKLKDNIPSMQFHQLQSTSTSTIKLILKITLYIGRKCTTWSILVLLPLFYRGEQWYCERWSDSLRFIKLTGSSTWASGFLVRCSLSCTTTPLSIVQAGFISSVI